MQGAGWEVRADRSGKLQSVQANATTAARPEKWKGKLAGVEGPGGCRGEVGELRGGP